MSKRKSPETNKPEQISFFDKKGNLRGDNFHESEMTPIYEQIDEQKVKQQPADILNDLLDQMAGDDTEELSAFEKELRCFHSESIPEESDDPRTLDGSIVPDYLNEASLDDKSRKNESGLSVEKLSTEEAKALGERAVKAADIDLYERSLSSMARKEIIARAKWQLDLKRQRTSYEAKQDAVASLAIIFNHYSQIGSNLGVERAIEMGIVEASDNYDGSVEIDRSYPIAEDYLMNFLANVPKKAEKSVYLDVNKGNKLRSLPEVIKNSMGIKDVEWFGKGYVPIRFSYEQKERFRQRMHESFATIKQYDPVLGSSVDSFSKERNQFIRDLSSMLAEERKKYRKDKRQKAASKP